MTNARLLAVVIFLKVFGSSADITANDVHSIVSMGTDPTGLASSTETRTSSAADACSEKRRKGPVATDTKPDTPAMTDQHHDCDSINKAKEVLKDDVIQRKDDVIQRALTPSLFSNVPPTIHFVRQEEQVEELPTAAKKRLRYYHSINKVIEEFVTRVGFTPTKEPQIHSFYFGQPYQLHRTDSYQTVKPHQKFNHFPDCWALGCKHHLADNLQRHKLRHGEDEFDFAPQTFVLPRDKDVFLQTLDESDEDQAWIIKPACSHGGQGIEVITKGQRVIVKQESVVQRYIPNPILIDGHKMDIRVYVLVGSIDPLRIYMYEEGQVRIAHERYSTDNFNKLTTHLTNFDVTLANINNDVKNAAKHKRKPLSWFWEHSGVQRQPVWDKIKDIVIKSIISGEAKIRDATLSNMASRYSNYEYLGFDIFLDDDLKPWIMEINTSPRMTYRTLKDMKSRMYRDLLNLVGVQIPDQDLANPKEKSKDTFPKHLVMDHRLWNYSLTNEEREKHDTYTAIKDEKLQQAMLDDLNPDDIRILIETMDENNRRGGFERIFPTPDTKRYHKLFEGPRYYNLLLHHWIQRYQHNEEEGIKVLESYCRQSKHLQP
ncbi:tubulin polyglutamylase TTLL4 [Lingula anatina]|uniref:Tubulin polyglutamylase TTLL4 n=1 Tax=Lingula anatina TaxID=7574 RepID=A0A1S3IHI8_LINAN|nr:tubulin polyglutamylase TTLL4 [Lingula anatina]|eukprot:XP_013397583.1 tubulin polyglutamylase TTLL4 [Lingula anatina]